MVFVVVSRFPCVAHKGPLASWDVSFICVCVCVWVGVSVGVGVGVAVRERDFGLCAFAAFNSVLCVCVFVFSVHVKPLSCYMYFASYVVC